MAKQIQQEPSQKYRSQKTASLKGRFLFWRNVKLRYILPVFALMISVLAASFTPTAPTASAADLASKMTLPDQTLSYAYLNGLRWCVKNSWGSLVDDTFGSIGVRITEASAKEGKWFYDETTWSLARAEPFRVAASYLDPDVGNTDSDRGFTLCQTVLENALPMWGYTGADGAFKLLCDMGVKRDNGSSCETGNGDFGNISSYEDELYNTIRKKVYNGTEPSLYISKYDGYPGRYLYYYNAFTDGCKAKVSASPAAQYKYVVTIANDDGTTKKVTYEGMDKGTQRFVYTDRDALNQLEYRCDKIAEEVSKYAGVYAEYRADHQEEPETTTPPGRTCDATGACTSAEGVSSCAIDGVGWIICPVVNFLAGLADGSFKILSDSLLRTDVNLVKTSSPTYTAWTVMRNIANVVFVIIFLIIIFSQLTGVGVSNYGVKKMLPRLVVAAILVNLSYFVCQLAVDLSNILGYSIKDALGGVGDSIVDATQSKNGISPFADGAGFLGIAGGVIAIAVGGVLIYALLSALIPVLLAAVIALVIILFMLIARQALVVILIVLSPLAFVAFLLPNTEKLFKMWRKMLVAMLLLFPIIALVFGLSSLASDIISLSFSGDFGDTSANNWFGQIVAAAVLVLPLFVIPTLLKKSLDGIPVLGQMASRMSGRANSKVGSKLKESYNGSRVARGAAIRKHAREVYKGRKFAEGVTKGGVAGGINQVLASGIPVTGAERAANKALRKSATSAMLKAQQEEVDDAKRLIEDKNLSGSQRQALALGKPLVDGAGKPIKGFSGDVVQKAAIQMQMGGAGSAGEVLDIVKASSGSLKRFSPTISQGAISAGGKNPALTGKRIDTISQGNFDYDTAMGEAISEGKYSAEAFAGMNDGAREDAIKFARAKEAAGDPSYIRALQQAAAGIQASPQISARIAGNKAAQDHVAGLLSGAPASILSAAAAATALGGASATASAGAPTTPAPTVTNAPTTATASAPAATTAAPAAGQQTPPGPPPRSTTTSTTTTPSNDGRFDVNPRGTVTASTPDRTVAPTTVVPSSDGLFTIGHDGTVTAPDSDNSQNPKP